MSESSHQTESSNKTDSSNATCTQSQPVEEPLYIAAGDEDEHFKSAILAELGELSPDEIQDTHNFLEELQFFQEDEEEEGEEDCFS